MQWMDRERNIREWLKENINLINKTLGLSTIESILQFNVNKIQKWNTEKDISHRVRVFIFFGSDFFLYTKEKKVEGISLLFKLSPKTDKGCS